MIVYRYGARQPTDGLALVENQMQLSHRYRNLLVEVERARRGAVRATLDAVPAVQVATAIAEATPEGTPGRKVAWGAVTAARKVAAQEQAAVLAAINDRAKAFGKVARARCGVYWGTYLLAEQAVDAARKSGEELRFRRWDGVGRVAVQLQGGLSVADALAGTDTQIRISQMPDRPGMTPGSRRSGQHYRVQMRIGSDGRAPVWASFEAILHRPLPADGTIKWAVLRRNKIGPDFRWSFQLTVDAQPASDALAVPDRAGTVALDLGWRMRPDGMRVGYWQDDTARHGEIVLPGEVLDDLAHIRSIGAIRDRLFNEFRDLLAGWARDGVDVPDWLARATATLAQWKSADRLAGLAWRWRAQRFAGDEAIFGPHPDCPRDKNGVLDCAAHVECWRCKDRHLYRWEAHGTANILARRDETYKRTAAVFARRYRTVVIEKFKLPDVHGRAGLGPKATDGEKVRADRASSRRHAGAPGTFRLALINACRARGTLVVEVPAEYTTQDCADCGVRNEFDAAPAIEHCCSACGVTWDQDRNAAVNLLRRYDASGPVVPSDGKALAGGKSARQQRFAKRRNGNGKPGEAAQDGRSHGNAEASVITEDGTRGVTSLVQQADS